MRVRLSTNKRKGPASVGSKRVRAGEDRRCVFFAELATTDAPADADKDKAVWVQVALEGAYKGYEGGEFSFDKGTFETIRNNFRAHPSYLAGADGFGSVDVVPWDFHHASELGPTSGSVPVMGAPAQGWVRDLDVRQGESGAELWALTRWLEPARTYILEGKYRWASVTVYFAARDAVSGKAKGATLLSIALTNKPFIEGMAELVAAEGRMGALLDARAERVGLSYNDRLGIYVEPSKDAEDALNQLRKVFGLPSTAGAGDVLAQISMVEQWVGAGGAPLGVDVSGIVGCMRTIFGLPALSSNDDVFAEAHKLMQALIEQETADEGTSGSMTPAPAPVAAENKNMDLLKKLAALLGLNPNDAAVLAEVQALFDLRVALCKALGLQPSAATGVLLDKGPGAVEKLGAILKALGVDNADSAIASLADKIKQANDLQAVMPELAELREFKSKSEDTVAEGEVAEAMASYELPDSVKDALLLMRKGKDGAKVFAEKFPKKAKPEGAAAGAAGANAGSALLTTLAAGQGVERRVTQNPDGSLQLSAPGAAGNGAPPPGVTVINLAAMPGRNRTERMIAHVRASLGADVSKYTYDQIFDRALNLLHDKGVKVTDVAA